MALLSLVIAFTLLARCQPITSNSPTAVETLTLDEARNQLRGIIEEVTLATASHYGMKDDLDNGMDTVKIIGVPETGGFAGVYHSYNQDTGKFHVSLATSNDLVSWNWQVELADNASQPTIKPAADGGYVAAWEQEPDNHLKFAYYPSWAELLVGTAAKTFDAPRQFSACAEGTPNLYSASSSRVEAGFHFFAYCDLDRQARGITDWRSWIPTEQPVLDRAVLIHGVLGSVGDRDAVRFEGYDFTLIEGQQARGDWRSWRIFLYDELSGIAEPLDIHTQAGSTAFSNPTIEWIQIGGENAVLVTLFLPEEGAAGEEAGQLIYYRIYQPASR